MKREILSLLMTLALGEARAETRYEFPAKIGPAVNMFIEASGDIAAIQPLIEDFQSANPDYAITYVDYLTNDLYERLLVTCMKGLGTADIVFSSSVDHIVKLANDGCAQPHISPETQKTPEYARWRDDVFGFTFEPAVIVYNRNLVPQGDVPHTRDALVDLLRDKSEVYSGRIGTYDIARSGIGYLFAFHDAQQSSAFGRIMEGFGRASAKLYCCTGELLTDIESGKLLIGYNLLGSYAYARFKSGAPIGIVLPSDYSLVLSRAAFVPANAPTPDAGKRFLDYLLSARGQNIVAEKSFYFAHGRKLPDGVDAGDRDLQSGTYRPIPIGPALLAVTDKHKRARLLMEWGNALARP
jgi:iron(III) transport system substrate-binding protein